MIELYIGNKNYSSWSMRPWLVLEHFHIPFVERFIPFDDFKSEQPFKQVMTEISPTAKVPALFDQSLAIWDSLAICEYLADLNPQKSLWPENIHQKAQARSMCAEMHSGFQNLRTLCGMNIEADLAHIGANLWKDNANLRAEVHRIEGIWESRAGLNHFLFGEKFCIADAFFAPVVMRFISYKLPVSESAQRYMQTILKLPAVRKWIKLALQEHLFVLSAEPYRDTRLGSLCEKSFFTQAMGGLGKI